MKTRKATIRLIDQHQAVEFFFDTGEELGRFLSTLPGFLTADRIGIDIQVAERPQPQSRGYDPFRGMP